MMIRSETEGKGEGREEERERKNGTSHKPNTRIMNN